MSTDDIYEGITETVAVYSTNWLGQVRRFMEARTAFVLVNWTEGFHYPELTGLAQEFDYQFLVVFKPDPHQSRGVFRPN